MIVYTANYGNRDFELPTNVVDLKRRYLKYVRQKDRDLTQTDLSGIEFVYFTDRPREISGWNVVVEKRRSGQLGGLMRSKWYKLHSHELFPNDVSMYIDANYGLMKKPEREFELTTAERPVTLVKHYRVSLFSEFQKCKHRGGQITKTDDLRDQRHIYTKEGWALDTMPVYRGSVLVRHPNAVDFNKAWWGDILRFKTRRDQLSLPVIAARYENQVNVISKLPATKMIKHTEYKNYRIEGSKVFYANGEMDFAAFRP